MSELSSNAVAVGFCSTGLFSVKITLSYYRVSPKVSKIPIQLNKPLKIAGRWTRILNVQIGCAFWHSNLQILQCQRLKAAELVA